MNELTQELVVNLVARIFLLIVISLILETAINVLKKLYSLWFPTGKIRTTITILLSITLSLIITITYAIDLLEILTGHVSLLGEIVTGLILAGGSAGMHELINKIKGVAEKQVEVAKELKSLYDTLPLEEQVDIVTEFNKELGPEVMGKYMDGPSHAPKQLEI